MKTVEEILNSDDPTAAAFNAGYDDPDGENPFDTDQYPRLWRYFQYGQGFAKSHARERAEAGEVGR